MGEMADYYLDTCDFDEEDFVLRNPFEDVPKGVWYPKGKSQIYIKDMSDLHLKNILNYLYKKGLNNCAKYKELLREQKKRLRDKK